MKAVALERRFEAAGRLPARCGDDVAGSLAQMGYAVTTLTSADLTPDTLAHLRCGGSSASGPSISEGSPRTSPAAVHLCRGRRECDLAVQPVGRTGPELAGPLPACASRGTASRMRNAPVTVLGARSSGLDPPNRITAADFEGWVQEARLYFPDQWDEPSSPRSSPAAIPVRRRFAGRPARGPAREGQFRVHQPRRGSPSFPRSARSVSAVRPISSRWASDPTTAARPAIRRRAGPSCQDSARGRASTCSCWDGSCSW
jgi:hypothetical protein